MSTNAPLAKIDFAPGIIKDDGPYQAEGGYVDSQWVRGRQGKPETKGGYLRLLASTTFLGVCRGAHAWSNQQTGIDVLMFGAGNNLYQVQGAIQTNITPTSVWDGYILDKNGIINTAPFALKTGSNIVTVTHPNHGLVVGQGIQFFADGSPVLGVVLTGVFTVATVISADQYTFVAATNSGGNSAGAGGRTRAIYSINTAGYNVPTNWSIDNFGADGLALPSGGPLLTWQPASSYPNIIYNGTFALGADGWAPDVGWTISGGTANGVAGVVSNLSQNIKRDAQPGRTYVMFVADNTTTGGKLTFKIDETVLVASHALGVTSHSWNLIFTMPPNAENFIIQKDAAWAGAIDNVSLTLLPTAFPVENAPQKANAMFVTSENAICLLGTYGYDDVFNPMIVRTSATKERTIWSPSSTTNAGEGNLALGSKIVSGINAGGQNYIFTDTAVYRMQYTQSNEEPYVYTHIGSGCGLIGQHAAVEVDGVVYWMSHEDFKMSDGGAPRSIESRVRNEVFRNKVKAHDAKIVCDVDSGKNEVSWYYVDARDGTTECSRRVVYRITENHWHIDKYPRSFFIDGGVFDYPLSFGLDGRIYQDECGTSADGAALDASLTTAWFDVADGDTLARIQRAVFEFQRQFCDVIMDVYGRNRPSDAGTLLGSYTFAPGTSVKDFRHEARQLKLVFRSSSTTNDWRFGAMAFEGTVTKKTR